MDISLLNNKIKDVPILIWTNDIVIMIIGNDDRHVSVSFWSRAPYSGKRHELSHVSNKFALLKYTYYVKVING